MADLETNNPTFEIAVKLQQNEKLIKVQQDETSDGVPVFKCYSDGKMLTEIRQDHEGTWDQLWGELEQEDINRVGESILNYLD
ncbi:hypothetical protein [Pedobacter antarcticus]|uniref:Uncharacterized protein n=2 Tax=Pedobacter antarcticus TaxID=34086 RepID=A0A081PJC6_9SPHI|nr:hypothetical protein [Pedobacter antarcticus]KEQ30799.1 hypothetical protein N180_10670 [Pedobacter antarcticus 4BY]SDM41441.1 hypothetical protein SAMN04488084_106199 [Pedobacter antarcticus]SFE92996.1 hypothetical protein SAMN03003324_01852 [Pedobacter antarcticus]